MIVLSHATTSRGAIARVHGIPQQRATRLGVPLFAGLTASARIIGHSNTLLRTTWADQLYATALLRMPGLTMPALPGGTLRLDKGETIAVSGNGGPLQVTRYDLFGIDTTPETMLLATLTTAPPILPVSQATRGWL